MIVRTDDVHYYNIADTIRTRFGSDELLKPSKMAVGILTIPNVNNYIDGSIEEIGSNVLSIRESACEGFESLVSVSFPRVESIGGSAFAWCISLKTINFPVIEYIGGYVFYGCTSLESVDFPLLTEIYDNTFADCEGLASVNLPLVESINWGAFENCIALETINIPTVEYIDSYVFYGCTALEYIDLPVVEHINEMAFEDCTALETVIIHTSTVCTIDDDIFENTPISDGTGYIYVPIALVDDYKQAADWSVYASQIRAIEDYPEITGGAEVPEE